MLPGGTDGWAVGDATGATVSDNIRWSGTFPSGAWSPGPTPKLICSRCRGCVLSLSALQHLAGSLLLTELSSNGMELAGCPGLTCCGRSAVRQCGLATWTHGLLALRSTIIRWNGASWTGPMVAPTAGIDYRSIKMVSATDGWIAGTLNPVTVEGLLLRWNGVAWNIVRSWVTENLNGLFMLPGGTSGSAVGDAETIIRWNNAQWISQTSPTAFPLFDVSMVSSNDGWAVGGGNIPPAPLALGSSIFRWDGTHWFHYETLPSPIRC